MLRETVVSWIRLRLGRSAPKKAWEESRAAFTARLKKVCEDINEPLDVEGLCRDFLSRIDKLVAKEGGRLAE